MNDSLSLAIPCRADEPGLGDTLESLYAACRYPALSDGLTRELLVCVNGVETGIACAPLSVVKAFCARYDIPLQEEWLGDDGELRRGATCGVLPWAGQALPLQSHLVIPVCTVLLTERKGKPPAWNALWRRATGATVLFCDADVRVDSEAVWFLYNRLQQEPHLSLVAAREVPVVEERGTVWSRMGALSYRFDLGNAGGRLLLIRRDALPEGIPEDLLLEDAWLTVAVGKPHVAKEWQAKVYFLPPASGRDYFAERVRTEGGKLQIRRAHRQLLERGPIATYHWSRFFKEIAVSEYPLVMLGLLIRGAAYLYARLALLNKEFYALYRPFRTTKTWSEP